MSTDYPQAIPMFLPVDWIFVDRDGYTGELSLVVHKTASPGQSSAQAVAAWFADRGANPKLKSSTYIVGQDGAIVQCVLEKDGAGGNCCLEAGHDPYWDTPGQPENKNVCTISVEHVDPSVNNTTPLTPAQKATSFALIADICKRHKIPPQRIFGHHSLDPIGKAECPGEYPLDELVAYVTTHLAGGVPTMGGLPAGAHDDGQTIKFANGLVMLHGFRAQYLRMCQAGQVPADDEPLENERSANPVEQSNPNWWQGAGTSQITRYFRFGWSPAKGVQVTWIGQELMWYMNALAKKP